MWTSIQKLSAATEFSSLRQNIFANDNEVFSNAVTTSTVSCASDRSGQFDNSRGQCDTHVHLDESVGDWDNSDDWTNEAGTSYSVVCDSMSTTLKKSDDTVNASGEDWLRTASVSFSPLSRKLAVAARQTAGIVSYEEVQRGSSLCMLNRGANFDDDIITAACLLPIRHTSKVGQEEFWSCLVLGYASGFINFISVAHDQVIYRLHLVQKRVKALKYYEITRGGEQEIGVLYDGCLLTINGLSAFTVLTACKNQIVSKSVSCFEELTDVANMGSNIWTFKSSDQETQTDFVCLGPVEVSAWDRLVSASIDGARPNLVEFPRYTAYATSGDNPFYVVWWAEEGKHSMRLRDAVWNFAESHLPNSVLKIGSIFGGLKTAVSPGSGNSQKKQQPQQHPVDALKRSGLADPKRIATSISVSPCGKLVALTDSLARVIVIKTSHSRAVYFCMHKGYREAQCAWVQVTDKVTREDYSGPCRTVFLVIYAPLFGILEVWPSNNAYRVHAEKVDKNGRLLYQVPLVFGPAAVVSDKNQLKKQQKPVTESAYFLDSNGTIFHFKVPFHAALQEASSNHLHDSSLLREVKLLFDNICDAKSTSAALDLNSQITKSLSKFRSVVLLTDALEAAATSDLFSNKALSEFFEIALRRCHEKSPTSALYDSPNVQRKFSERCECVLQALNVHALLRAFHNSQSERDDIGLSHAPYDHLQSADWLGCGTVNENVSEIEILARGLGLETFEIDMYIKDLELNVSELSRVSLPSSSLSNSAAVKMPMKFSVFYKCFEWSATHLFLSSQTSVPNEAARTTSLSTCSETSTAGSGAATCFHKLVLQPNLQKPAKHVLGRFLFQPFLVGDASVKQFREQVLPQLGLASNVLVELLTNACLDTRHQFSIRPLSAFELLKDLLMVESSHPSLASIIERLEQSILGCSFYAEAFSFAIFVRAAIQTVSGAKEENQTIKFSEESRGHDNVNSSVIGELKDVDVFDWVEIKPRIERWDVLLRLLHGLLLVETLLCQSVSPSAPGFTTLATPSDLLQQHGRTVFLQLIAACLARNGINSKNLVALFQKICSSNETSVPSQRIGQSENDEKWVALLMRLRQCFPLSLSLDRLFCACAAELCTLWTTNKARLDCLETAHEYIRNISSAMVQHGIVRLLWNVHFERPFEAMSYLIEKVGKLPKDRLCKQELGLENAAALTRFAQVSESLLHLLLLSVEDYDHSLTPPPTVYEDFLENFVLEVESDSNDEHRKIVVPQATCLADRAALEKCTAYLIVKHHWHLALVIRLSLETKLKPNKPLSLFDIKGRNAFFKSFYSHPLLSMADVEPRLLATRKDFFCQLISSLLLCCHDELCAKELTTEKEAGNRNTTLATAWENYFPMSIWKNILVLATEFAIDRDCLYRHLICNLFLFGANSLAQRFLSSVEKQMLLGSDLLKVAGQMVEHLMRSQLTQSGWSLLSPTLRTWLEMTEIGTLRFKDFDAEVVRFLLDLVLTYLPSGSAELKIAQELRELLEKC